MEVTLGAVTIFECRVPSPAAKGIRMNSGAGRVPVNSQQTEETRENSDNSGFRLRRFHGHWMRYIVIMSSDPLHGHLLEREVGSFACCWSVWPVGH